MQKNETPHSRGRSKKAQILALYTDGLTDIVELSEVTGSHASYVATVLQEAGLLPGYFDLYTHSDHPMNVYSRFFSGKLGFKDEDTAKTGVELLETFYRQFDQEGDRAGQHHTLTVALTLFDRARWSGKIREAEWYRHWLLSKIGDRPHVNEPSAHSSLDPSIHH
jgi:hypothetical protein